MRILIGFLLVFVLISTLINGGNTSTYQYDDIKKIMQAKEYVRSLARYPDTLDFHDMQTEVNGNNVTLTFTAENAFGVQKTETMIIPVY